MYFFNKIFAYMHAYVLVYVRVHAYGDPGWRRECENRRRASAGYLCRIERRDWNWINGERFWFGRSIDNRQGHSRWYGKFGDASKEISLKNDSPEDNGDEVAAENDNMVIWPAYVYACTNLFFIILKIYYKLSLTWYLVIRMRVRYYKVLKTICPLAYALVLHRSGA